MGSQVAPESQQSLLGRPKHSYSGSAKVLRALKAERIGNGHR